MLHSHFRLSPPACAVRKSGSLNGVGCSGNGTKVFQLAGELEALAHWRPLSGLTDPAQSRAGRARPWNV
jgi:hypothetical protein